jgi:hypothetical protein
MKRILAAIIGGLLMVSLASCCGKVAGTPRDIEEPSASGEVHRYGPGGSIADEDLSQYDFNTRTMIDATR